MSIDWLRDQERGTFVVDCEFTLFFLCLSAGHTSHDHDDDGGGTSAKFFGGEVVDASKRRSSATSTSTAVPDSKRQRIYRSRSVSFSCLIH